MDDMKKLVEKYKRELMEYSRAAAPGKLEFPEMLPEEPKDTQEPSPPQDTPDQPRVLPADAAPEAPRAPTIISWSPDQTAASDLEKYFSELSRPADESQQSQEPQGTPAATDSPDDFTTLPPQFTDEAPQNDFTNNAVDVENNNIKDINEPEQPAQFQREGENTTADPAQFESIGTIPESGQSPDEQLGRRSFENQQPAVNSRDDVKPLVQTENDNFPDYPKEPEYADLDEFLRANTQQGSLRFRTYTARNALPVPGANVKISKIIGGSRHMFYDLTTDESGQTPVVNVPAPSSSLSQTPNCAVQPYSLYDADITAKGYIPISIRGLPIFEGILSVQRTAMVPSIGIGEKETIAETEPDLTEVPDA